MLFSLNELEIDVKVVDAVDGKWVHSQGRTQFSERTRVVFDGKCVLSEKINTKNSRNKKVDWLLRRKEIPLQIRCKTSAGSGSQQYPDVLSTVFGKYLTLWYERRCAWTEPCKTWVQIQLIRLFPSCLLLSWLFDYFWNVKLFKSVISLLSLRFTSPFYPCFCSRQRSLPLSRLLFLPPFTSIVISNHDIVNLCHG